MKWMTSSLVLLVAIGGVHLQCFSPDDDFQAATYSTDLSAIMDFSMELFKQLSPGQSSRNFFFSPYSIWTALTMAYFGSAGNTQRQLETALRVSDKVSTIKLWKALDVLYAERKRSTTNITFSLANRIYVQEGLQLRSCVLDLLQNELRTLNANDLATSAKEINTFVSETTNGRITDIVNQNDISNSLMVLVNAAYFKGIWKYQFDPSETRQMDFFITSQNSAPVTMMTKREHFRYGESIQLGARVLELPYTGEAISMFLLLPSSNRPAGTRFTTMINNLNGVTLREAIAPKNLLSDDVEVQLPKFKAEFTVEDELQTALENLGITDIFDGSLANMTTFTPYGAGMNIGKTIHKSFVEVNEEGTEAAAATVLFITYSAVRSRPIEFHCHEPFVYFLYDKQTSNVLFIGTFTGPSGL